MFHLKDLCALYKKHSEDAAECCSDRTNFLIANKGQFHFEELDRTDVDGLREYLLCDILAIYEYLSITDKAETAEWFTEFKGMTCSMEENDDYKALAELGRIIGGCNPEGAFKAALENSIEPFKSRGIACTHFDYTV